MLRWFLSGCGLALHLHGGVEVALGLQIVAQVATAFIQQIVIDRVFLVDRNQLLRAARC